MSDVSTLREEAHLPAGLCKSAAKRCLLPVVPSFLEGALGHLERGEDLDEKSGGGVGQLLRTFHARQRVDDDLVVDQYDVEQAHAVFQTAPSELVRSFACGQPARLWLIRL